MASHSPSGLAHLVFFTLKDSSTATKVNFVAECEKYLSDHPGCTHFSVGTRATSYDRPVNDTDYDVSVHLIFSTEADHDRYQVSDRHQNFLAQQSDNWSRVRIFDTLV